MQPISSDDYVQIQRLFIRYSNMIDERQYSRIDEVFTDDAIYDATAFGLGRHAGKTEIASCLLAAEPNHPLLHVPINAEVGTDDQGVVRSFSRCLAILDTGAVSQCTYNDVLVKTAAGWRIDERIITPRTTEDIPAAS